MYPTFDRAAQKASIFEDTDVLGSSGQGHGVGGGKFGDRALTGRELIDHGPTGSIREGMEDAIQGQGQMLNHLVDDCRMVRLAQDAGTHSYARPEE
ncbi:hypothetical protein ASF56_16330 [Methylobacterium sp. Leaf122]|nr:hypothetical protein ASF33_19235 [Methylobacterium sp. Leaf92]KQQ15752.1 hypothetical protein ASF59_13650 [Methylobacterium sp. Leaf121]KQQ24116.1 hypothetical protein ASF56_16330 [Methylobacterium sp. Leaf122]